ncbi:MAG: metallophosphoesterase family protein [Promethearchaeota archaeon]
MFKLDLSEGDYPIILKPNLGQPTLINIRDFIDNTGSIIKNIVFDAYIITVPTQSVDEILQFFHLNFFITPILKDAGEFSERRGESYPLQILEISKLKSLDFRNQTVLNEEDCLIWDICNNLSQIDNLFGKRTELYKIKVQIKEIKNIYKIFNESNRSVLLFDIVHDLPNRIDHKVNYHAIALFDKNWSNFKFIHATDFHIARRNDFISKFLKDKALDNTNRYKNHPRIVKKLDTLILSRDFEYKRDFQENNLEKLRYAKYNFNYNLRLLIRFINEQVSKNGLDFVLMTGDLLDYIKIARGNNQYKNNFEVFIDILLGINRGLDKAPYFNEDEYLNTREILAPIFTIVGNHDYRKGHYGISIGSIHKIFGLTKKNIKGYHDLESFNYFTALKSKDKYLKNYFRQINPNLNYSLKIGKDYNFIFLDTGQDSVADLHDLLKGSPSTKGLKDHQIELLRRYIKLSYDDKIIIVMHTPPISPNFGVLTRWKIKRKFNLKRELKWSDLYERGLEKYLGNARLDRVVNLKYQTIMYNWANFLKICTGSDKEIRRKVDLVLCGHTHTIKEFRLKEAREMEKISMGFYFTKIPITVPCEVYASRYRDVFKTFKNEMDLKIWFDVNKPFIFQTQAVGPLSLKYKFKSPGFRYIIVKNSQITRVNIYSLHFKENKRILT